MRICFLLLVVLLTTTPASGACEGPESLQQAAQARSRQDYAAAIALLESCVDRNPAHVQYRLELAVTYAWSGRLSDALQAYKAVLHHEPANRPARLGEAWVTAWQGDAEEALARFGRLLQEDPRDLEALSGTGFVHRSRLRYGAARRAYTRMLQLDPTHAEARAALQSMRETPLLRVTTHLGGALLDDGRRVYGNRLHATYRMRPGLTLAGALTTENEQRDLFLPFDAHTRKRFMLGANLRLGDTWSTNLSLAARHSDGPAVYALQAGFTRTLSPRTTLLFSLKSGIGAGQRELLLSGGLLVTLNKGSHLLLQAFQFSDFQGYRSVSFTAGGHMQVTKRLALNPSFSLLSDSYQQQWDYALNATYRFSTTFSLGVQTGKGPDTLRPSRLGLVLSYAR